MSALLSPPPHFELEETDRLSEALSQRLQRIAAEQVTDIPDTPPRTPSRIEPETTRVGVAVRSSLPSTGLCVAAVAVAWASSQTWFNQLGLASSTRTLLILALIVAVGLFQGIRWGYRFIFIGYHITAHSVWIERGPLYPEAHGVDLDSLKEVRTGGHLLQRLLGVGSVELVGRDEASSILLTDVAAPTRLAEYLGQAVVSRVEPDRALDLDQQTRFKHSEAEYLGQTDTAHRVPDRDAILEQETRLTNAEAATLSAAHASRLDPDRVPDLDQEELQNDAEAATLPAAHAFRLDPDRVPDSDQEMRFNHSEAEYLDPTDAARRVPDRDAILEQETRLSDSDAETLSTAHASHLDPDRVPDLDDEELLDEAEAAQESALAAFRRQFADGAFPELSAK